jgi:hypothetical protein
MNKRFAAQLALAAVVGGAAFVLPAARTLAEPPAARAAQAGAQELGRTGQFQGPKANTGYAIARRDNGRLILSVSDDFKIPDTPAPSWQVVDTAGNTYLLNQFKIKGGTNRQVRLPTYVKDVAKVQVWCSYAEVLLGEAPFASPVH